MSYIMNDSDYQSLRAALEDANAAVEQYRSTVEKLTQERQAQQATIVRLSGRLAAAGRETADNARKNIVAAQQVASIEDLKRKLKVEETIARQEHQKKLEAEQALHMAKVEHGQEMVHLKLQMQRREEDHAALVREVHLLRGQIRQDNTTIEQLRTQAGAAAANFVTPGQVPFQDLLMRKNAEIESLHGIVNRLNVHIANERKVRHQLEDELDKARSVNSELDAHCSRLCQKHNQLVEENDSLRKQLDAGIRPLEERIANQRLEIARLTKTCSQGAIADLKVTYNQLADKYDRLVEENEEKEREVDRLREQVDKTYRENRTLASQNSELKRLVDDCATKQREDTAITSTCIANLRKENNRLQLANDTLAKVIDDNLHATSYMTTSLGDLPIDSTGMRRLSDEVGRLQGSLTRLTAELGKSAEKVGRLKQENIALTSMVNSADKQNPYRF